MTAEKIETAAKYIVEHIISDLTGRRGLRQGWDEIDEDIQEEIKEGWKYIAIAAMNDDMN